MATKKVVEPGTEKIVKTVRRTNKATGEGTFTEFGAMNEDGTQFQRQTRIKGDLSDIPTQESTRLTDVADAVTGRKERVRTQADIPFLENQQIGQQFGIPTEGLPGNLQESLDMQSAEFARQKAFREGEIDFQEQQQLAQQARLRQQQMSAVESVEASLSQGREGIFSTSMAQAKDVFTTALRQDMKQAADAFNFAQTQRAEAKRQLQLAEQGNNQKLIQQAKVALQQAENELVQQETNLRNSQAKAAEAAIGISKEARAERQSQIENATNFINTIGSIPNLPPQAALALAGQFGLPKGLASEYYLATESIRQDKSLDQEEKRLKLDEAKFKFENEIVDGALALDNKLKYYDEQVRKGEDPTRLAIELDIPVAENPIFQLQFRKSAAEARIKEIEASGKPIPGSKEDIDLQMAKLELERTKAEQAEIFGDVVLEPADQGINDVDLNVPGANNILSYTKIIPGSSANAEGVDFVAPVNTPVKSNVTGNVVGVFNTAVPGDFDANGGWGNQVIIESGGRQYLFNHLNNVNVAQGDFITAGTQIGGVGNTGRVMKEDGSTPTPEELAAGRGAHLDYTVKENGKKVSLDEAFRLANGSQVSTPGASSVLPTLTAIARVSDKKDVEANFKRLSKLPDKKPLQDYVATIVFEDLPPEQQKAQLLRANLVESGQEVVALIDDFVAAGGDLDVFTGSLLKMRNKVGAIDDPARQEIAQRIQLMLEDFGRAQTGAAIQDFEKKTFKAILPSIYDGPQLASSKIKAFSSALQTQVRSNIKTKLRETVYNEIYTDANPTAGMTPEQKSEYWSNQSRQENLYNKYNINTQE